MRGLGLIQDFHPPVRPYGTCLAVLNKQMCSMSIIRSKWAICLSWPTTCQVKMASWRATVLFQSPHLIDSHSPSSCVSWIGSDRVEAPREPGVKVQAGLSEPLHFNGASQKICAAGEVTYHPMRSLWDSMGHTHTFPAFYKVVTSPVLVGLRQHGSRSIWSCLPPVLLKRTHRNQSMWCKTVIC